MTKTLRLVLLVVSYILFPTSLLFAGLSVDPVVLEVVADRGIGAEGYFKLLNTGEKPIQIQIKPEKIKGTDIEIGAWLRLEPEEFELKPNEKREVAYKITVPKGSKGELRCMIFFVADEIGENRSNIGIRFGVPVYAIVGGTEVVDAEVSKIEVNYTNKVLRGRLFVNNRSNIHIRPNISIEIQDTKGKMIRRFAIPFGQPAQAGQNRLFMFQEQVELVKGDYRLLVSVDYGRMYGLDKVAKKEIEFVVEQETVDKEMEADEGKE